MTKRWHELLMDDHEITEKVFAAVDQAMASAEGPSSEVVSGMLAYFGTYVDQCHHKKEEDYLFPLLERLGMPRHGGPLAIMLSEHAQSRAILDRLKPLALACVRGERAKLPELRVVVKEYGELLKQHFWKENDILYPMALRIMSEADEADVLAGIERTEAALGQGTRARFYGLADQIMNAGKLEDLSLGLERTVLAAMLNTLPVEISFVDADDTVRYFSHENRTKIFPRTRGAIGTKVQNCHPQKSLHLVNRIVADFKAGTRELAEFWIDMGGKKVHIRYFPVRGAKGEYLGCMEVVQDVTAIQKLEGQRRLLAEAG